MTKNLFNRYLEGKVDALDALRQARSELKRMRLELEAMERFEALLVGASQANPLEDITPEQTASVQNAIERCGRLRADAQSKDWAGHVIAKTLNIDVSVKSNRQRVKKMIDRWVQDGALKFEHVRDSRQGRDVGTIVAATPMEADQ